jgi:hypothetical protein
MSFDPLSHIAYTVAYNYVECHGRQFPFVPHDVRSRREAVTAAQRYGAERASLMGQQAGRRLTPKEARTGELEIPGEPSRPQIFQQPEPDPTYNHWRARLEELRRQPAHTWDQKARLKRRIDSAEELADKFDQELAKRQPPSADLARLRRHAAACYERVRSDPQATPSEIADRKRLLELANGDTTPGQYWEAVRALEPAPDLPPDPGNQLNEQQ